jgi:3-hydroxyisobutyrate dehydrogenase
MSADSVWLQMSTIGETATARCAELAEPHLISFVDAPVLGSRGPAENRELITLASGPQQLRDQLQPVFDAFSRKTIWLGPAGAGTRLKLVLNAWVLTVVEAGAELVALAEGFGLDPAMIFEALDGGPLDLPYLRMKAKAIAERDFQPAFRLALAAKDAQLAEEAASRRGLELPLLTLLAERLALGAATYPDQDISATYLTLPSRGA